MTDQSRTARVSFAFLSKNGAYQARIYRDGASKTELTTETKTVTPQDNLELLMLDHGGFALHLRAVK